MKFHATRAMTLMAAAILVLLATALPAAADTQVIHDTDTFSVFVPCANGGLGETVNGVVNVRGLISETDDGAGGVHLRFQLRFRGVGVGDVTGDTYRLHEDTPFIFLGDRLNANAGGSFNAAIDFDLDAIGQGNAPNFSVSAHEQITVNANGVETMHKGNIFAPVATCR